MPQKKLSDAGFQNLELSKALRRGIDDAGFTKCTPIQEKSLPLALAGTDIQGQAQTGTGKTAAFLVATMNWLLIHQRPGEKNARRPRALILAPTRELAIQIHKDALLLGKHTELKTAVVYGGTAYEQQREEVRGGVDILIGTPGRIIDYFKQGIFRLNGIQVAVIDEADRMFDLGFIKDVRYLFRRMPPPQKRLNLLFSATLSFRVSELAYEHMNNPTIVNATPETVTVDKVSQILYHVSNDEKISLLLGLLGREEMTRTIIFVNMKRTGERLNDYLRANDFNAGMLSGNVPQTKRLRLLERFSSGKLPILVATDVAARGLHIPGVSHVVNYDLPQDPEDYVHRIGRTARSGASGYAVSFACEQYVYSLVDIEAFLGMSIPSGKIDETLMVLPKSPKRHVSQSRKSQRKNSGTRRKPRSTAGFSD